jgi:hypothetical protein
MGIPAMSAAAPMTVRLERTVDGQRPCCKNLAYVLCGHGPHAAALRCTECGRHRGWLPKSGLTFITELAGRFGAPPTPIVLSDRTIGDFKMNKEPFKTKPGYGQLFKNKQKDPMKKDDPDYWGDVNFEGVDVRLNGWLRDGPKGKYISLSAKRKDEAAAKKPAAEFHDADVPF